MAWLALLAAALPAAAQVTQPPPVERPLQPLWELGVGVAALTLPHYRGSEQSHSWALPLPYVVYRGNILRADRDGARAVLLDGARTDLDISLAAGAPTESDDNRARAGMADLKPTVEVGPNLNVTLVQGSGWKLQARLPLRAVFTVERDPRSLGFTASPVLNVDWRIAGWNLGVQGGPLLATARNHAYFYGVGAADATAARPAYAAPGGFAGWRGTLGASRRLGSFWLGAFVRADSLHGARFEDSPLVTRRQHLAGGVALSWVFARSSEHVASER